MRVLQCGEQTTGIGVIKTNLQALQKLSCYIGIAEVKIVGLEAESILVLKNPLRKWDDASDHL